MHERETDEHIADMLEVAELAGEVEAGEVQVDAMDLVRILQEVKDWRADALAESDSVTALADDLIAWANTDTGARAAHKAWVDAMAAAHRDVSRHDSKWGILVPDTQLLHARIAVLFMTAALEGVHEEGVHEEGVTGG